MDINNILYTWPCKYRDLIMLIIYTHIHSILLYHFWDTTVYNVLWCYLVNLVSYFGQTISDQHSLNL